MRLLVQSPGIASLTSEPREPDLAHRGPWSRTDVLMGDGAPSLPICRCTQNARLERAQSALSLSPPTPQNALAMFP